MMARIRRTTEERGEVSRLEGTSDEFTLRAGNDVRDSRDVECEEEGFGGGRSILELTDWLVEK